MREHLQLDYTALSDLRAGSALPGATEADAGTLVVFAGGELAFGEATRALLGEAGIELVKRAAAATKFKGKAGSAVDLVAPHGIAADRLLVIGAGKADEKKVDDKTEGAAKEGASKEKDGKPPEMINIGGAVAGKLRAGSRATVVFDLPKTPEDLRRAVTDFAVGLRLRDYKFDTYKTKKKKDEPDENGATRVTIALSDVAAAEGRIDERDGLVDGVLMARSLVNEPPNVLYPEAFADRIGALRDVGVEVEVLDIPALEKLGMGAFLGVSQGSARPGRIVIMRWNGGGTGDGEADRPVAFLGKGVTFDTGGISIKPSGGMEDMKGDMAGAACVVGLMHALARRKAKCNVVGAVGLVENMPGPNAQRPGDIVTSMSGQTIEIINTDAEGRLVLADLCWYVQDRFKPRFMVDLATLTGAIIVALGQEYGGLFCNNDELADRLLAAGTATGEKLWRMPLAPAYDKLIDSRFADVKNSGGRHASSITAAQFIGRFVNDVPWAHLDIAGMGMSSPSNDINQSWGSGWGVRLLNRLVADHYEAG